jgi:hypothetical protein
MRMVPDIHYSPGIRDAVFPAAGAHLLLPAVRFRIVPGRQDELEHKRAQKTLEKILANH